MSDSGVIKLRRISNFAAYLRKFDVLVDGRKIGNIANGKEMSFDVAAGQHTLQVSSFARSELLQIDLSPSAVVELECGISAEFWLRNLLFFIGIYLLFHFSGHGMPGLRPVRVPIILVAAVIVTITNLRKGGTYYLKKLGGIQ